MKIRFAARMREGLVVVSIAAATLSPATFAGPARVLMTVNNTVVFDESKTFQTDAAGTINQQSTTNNYSGSAFVGVAPAYTVATAEISTAGTGETRATTKQTSQFRVRQPMGAAVAGGKLVLYFTLDAELTGNASVEPKVTVELVPLSGSLSTGEASGIVTNQPGRDTVQFDVTTPIPADFPEAGSVYISLTLDLTSVARIAGAASRQASKAEVKDLQAIGFRVFNAAGAQVPGFSLSGGRAIPEFAAPTPGQAPAVEFYNSQFDHYFITSNPVEINNLTSGVTPGWVLTGQRFNVLTSPGVGLATVCRFFSTTFAPKSSHFYTGNAAECAALPAGMTWTYEGDVFYAALPDTNGGCPAGQIPVYRLYNDGKGGAPNHRFTTNQATQVLMIAEGYVQEGPAGVGWCSPL